MLYNFFISFKFHRFCQSGFYIDFFLKKISEVFIRNIFIYLAQFFAEKYMIEFLTKKIVINSIFYFNRFFGWFKLEYFNFFLQFIYIVFYIIAIFNLILLI